jgi:hypothetical protein
MKWILIALVCVPVTLIFDLICFKVSQAIEVEKSWRAVNDQRERDGKERWDKRK